MDNSMLGASRAFQRLLCVMPYHADQLQDPVPPQDVALLRGHLPASDYYNLWVLPESRRIEPRTADKSLLPRGTVRKLICGHEWNHTNLGGNPAIVFTPTQEESSMDKKLMDAVNAQTPKFDDSMSVSETVDVKLSGEDVADLSKAESYLSGILPVEPFVSDAYAGAVAQPAGKVFAEHVDRGEPHVEMSLAYATGGVRTTEPLTGEEINLLMAEIQAWFAEGNDLNDRDGDPYNFYDLLKQHTRVKAICGWINPRITGIYVDDVILRGLVRGAPLPPLGMTPHHVEAIMEVRNRIFKLGNALKGVTARVVDDRPKLDVGQMEIGTYLTTPKASPGMRSFNADFEGLDPIEDMMDRIRVANSQNGERPIPDRSRGERVFPNLYEPSVGGAVFPDLGDEALAAQGITPETHPHLWDDVDTQIALRQRALSEPVVIDLTELEQEMSQPETERLEVVAEASGGVAPESIVLLARTWVRETIMVWQKPEETDSHHNRLKLMLIKAIEENDERSLAALLEAGFEWGFDKEQGLASLSWKGRILKVQKDEVLAAEVPAVDNPNLKFILRSFPNVPGELAWVSANPKMDIYFDFTKWNYAGPTYLQGEVRCFLKWVDNKLMLEPTFLPGFYMPATEFTLTQVVYNTLIQTGALIMESTGE